MSESLDLLFEIRLPAKADRLGLLREIVRKAAVSAGCSEELSQKLVIAVNEACMNVIQHAYHGTPDGDFQLAVSKHGNRLVFRLTDHAVPADLERIRPRDLNDIRPGGLGVHFIREIMDDVSFGHLQGGRGNYLEMMKNIE